MAVPEHPTVYATNSDLTLKLLQKAQISVLEKNNCVGFEPVMAYPEIG